MSKTKSFLYGQASGMVEPIAGVLGALFVMNMRSIFPYALCFAVGAMILWWWKNLSLSLRENIRI
jgi:ZIP family zinc transporter